MQVEQVFAAYAHQGSLPPRACFCPQCCAGVQPLAGQHRGRCPTCGWVDYRNPAPGVVVLIVEDDQVLLGRRGPGSFQSGRWCLPGGFIEYEEDYLSAARREVYEETGLDVELAAILSVISNFLAPGLHTLVVTLLARRIGGEQRPGDDIAALAWFPLAGPLPEMAFAADRHIIQRYAATRLPGAPLDLRYAARVD